MITRVECNGYLGKYGKGSLKANLVKGALEDYCIPAGLAILLERPAPDGTGR